jgi:hypothetical protein
MVAVGIALLAGAGWCLIPLCWLLRPELTAGLGLCALPHLRRAALGLVLSLAACTCDLSGAAPPNASFVAGAGWVLLTGGLIFSGLLITIAMIGVRAGLLHGISIAATGLFVSGAALMAVGTI